MLGDLDRCSKKIERLQALVDEGSFSRSLFENLDLEKARMGDLSARQEKLAAEVAMARSKAAALHEPEHLIAAIRCGSDPELRLRLKRVFEKFYLGASRLSMRRMAARSMKASEVWTFNS